jgi:hypothetical protein
MNLIAGFQRRNLRCESSAGSPFDKAAVAG